MFHVRPGHPRSARDPLSTLMRSACGIGWDWGRRCIEQLVAESDDPVAVGMRESGEYALAFALACASAGSSNSLQWAEAFAAGAGGEERRSSLVAEAAVVDVAGFCTLGVAEWLWQADGSDLPCRSVYQAAATGNWAVMEWMVRTGGVDATTCNCFAAAAGQNSVAAMRFLCTHGLDRFSEDAAIVAASKGGLSVLEWLWSEKSECVTRECAYRAAMSGDVDKLRFLLQRCGVEWTKAAALVAADYGRVRVLEWAHGQRLAIPQELPGIARFGTSVFTYAVAQFLLTHAQVLHCSTDNMGRACRLDLCLVEALHARFPYVLSQDTKGHCLEKAASAGRMDVVEFILRHTETPVCTEGALADACAGNQVGLAQLLHSRFPDVPLSSLAMRRACEFGALEAVEWLHQEHGVALDPAGAICTGRLQVLEFGFRHCGPLDQAGLLSTVQYHHHLHVVEFLVRRGLVDDVSSLLQIAKQHGSPWPMQRFLRRHAAS